MLRQLDRRNAFRYVTPASFTSAAADVTSCANPQPPRTTGTARRNPSSPADPVRMTWMRDLLEAAASRIQVVVMTCHPEHYAVENGRRHVVDLSSCVQRRTIAAAQRIGG